MNTNREIIFECRICNKEVQFNPGDTSSFLGYEEEPAVFGMTLTIYRIAHPVSTTKRHVNSVVIDQNGEYRGHRDAYEESIESSTTVDSEETIETEKFETFEEGVSLFASKMLRGLKKKS